MTARALRERGHEPLLVTEGRTVEREFLERQGAGVESLGLDGAAERARPSRLRLPWWLLQKTLRARRILAEKRIGCVVSTGGRASVPLGIAARTLGVPLFLLEQNAVTGRANRWLQRFAQRIYLGLPGPAVTAHAIVTGTPLRPELYRSDRRQARAALGLRHDLPVVLVTGGSQGAQALNVVVPAALSQVDRPVQVVHLAGLSADADVRLRYAGQEKIALAIVRAVAMDMDRLLGAADLVVCRGGGTTVAELMAAGRPAIIVPYPHHRDQQQLRNARVLERAGAAIVVEERDLQASALARTVDDLLAQPERLATMAGAARGLCAADPTAAILGDMQRHGGLA